MGELPTVTISKKSIFITKIFNANILRIERKNLKNVAIEE